MSPTKDGQLEAVKVAGEGELQALLKRLKQQQEPRGNVNYKLALSSTPPKVFRCLRIDGLRVVGDQAFLIFARALMTGDTVSPDAARRVSYTLEERHPPRNAPWQPERYRPEIQGLPDTVQSRLRNLQIDNAY